MPICGTLLYQHFPMSW